MRNLAKFWTVGILFLALGGSAQAALIEGSIAFGSVNPPSLVGGADLLSAQDLISLMGRPQS